MHAISGVSFVAANPRSDSCKSCQSLELSLKSPKKRSALKVWSWAGATVTAFSVAWGSRISRRLSAEAIDDWAKVCEAVWQDKDGVLTALYSERRL